ncbi:hypothetical protein ACEPAI_5372 [Sanghuangporus weigelae]
MRPTLACFSKASRMPLTPKRGNKDYYKGTRQASLPGLRTGAPGKYFGRGTNAYRLLDERVRVFVAPPIKELNNSSVCLALQYKFCHPLTDFPPLLRTEQLKPYVPWMTYLSEEDMFKQPFGKLPSGGLNGQIYLDTVKGRRKPETGLVVLNAEGEVIS